MVDSRAIPELDKDTLQLHESSWAMKRIAAVEWELLALPSSFPHNSNLWQVSVNISGEKSLAASFFLAATFHQVNLL